jgi:alpha-ketoglutarate-dependent taurine dioxygenase
MDFAVRPLAPGIGAEIGGLDLGGPLDDETMARVRRVWLDHVIALFPGQELNVERQIAFSRRIGELELINMSSLQLPGRPEIYQVTNLDIDGNVMPPEHPIMQTNRDNQRWHSDSSFKRVPATASLLYAYVVPEAGGETAFANMAAAYDALDAAVKRRIDGLIAVHDFYWSRREIERDAFTEAERQALPPVRHPVARVHPETGCKAIYVGSHTESIEGMDWEEGRALIDSLIAHATRPEFTYTHKWRPGDLIIWDNRAALHRGLPFDAKQQKRRLHRTTVAGTGPTL